jgi:regulator of cell morphogenesis and NO signaling
MMRHEHDDRGEEPRALAALTGDMTAPEGACNAWRALDAGIAKLAEDPTEHMHIESHVFFARFETRDERPNAVSGSVSSA